MKAHNDKPQAPKSVTPALHHTAQSAGGKAHFADKRLGTLVQRKLQEGMADSPRGEGAAQLRKHMQAGMAKPALPVQRKANATGLPATLKSGIENLSGYAMDDVKVHYNSSKPAQLQAHAYAQGSDIHVAAGQEKHLPHEAWHVVQQKQGRVKPTMQFKSKVAINDDAGLEKEADVMGARALSGAALRADTHPATFQLAADSGVLQREHDPEMEYDVDEFLSRLDELIAFSEQEYGGTFRLIEWEGMMRDCPQAVEAAFMDFVRQGVAAAQNSPLHAYLVENLKKKFGYDRVAEIQARLIGPLGWGNLHFKTKGYRYDAFASYPWHKATHQSMLAKLQGGSNPEGKLKEFVESGNEAPEVKQVVRGDKFYKLMKPGDNFMRSTSAYYLSWAELQTILNGEHLADHLGLPLINYSAVYCVYEIEAQGPTEVFESTIAPTEQTILRTNKTKFNSGGRRQTLILDSTTNLWVKDPTPKYILDPNEVELLALRHHLNT